MNRVIIRPIRGISGIVLKIGGKLYNEDQLYGRTLYTTKKIKTKKSTRWNIEKFEDLVFEPGDMIGNYYSHAVRNGQVYLIFDAGLTWEPALNKDVANTFSVPYTPGLIELESLQSQGAKDAETQAKEAEDKGNGGIWDMLGLSDLHIGQTVKWVGIGLGAYLTLQLIRNITPPPPR